MPSYNQNSVSGTLFRTCLIIFLMSYTFPKSQWDRNNPAVIWCWNPSHSAVSNVKITSNTSRGPSRCSNSS